MKLSEKWKWKCACFMNSSVDKMKWKRRHLPIFIAVSVICSLQVEFFVSGSLYGEHFEEQFFPNRTLSIFGQESVLNGGTSEDKGVIWRWKKIPSASGNFQCNVF